MEQLKCFKCVCERERETEKDRARERNTKLQCFTVFGLSFSGGTLSLISNKLNITENLK